MELLSMMHCKVQTMTPVLFEQRFCCCICMDIYRDPVSIPCGHNFCLDCIERFWDTKVKNECPLCKEAFRERPDLRINHNFADIIDIFRRSPSPTPEDIDVPTSFKCDSVPCDICHGDKMTAVKSCLVCQASYCEIHLSPHLRDPALQRHRRTDPATFTTSHLCRKHNKPLGMFCTTDQTPVCGKCVTAEHKHHQIVPMERESRRVKVQLRQTNSDIQQQVQVRLKTMEAVKHSVEVGKTVTQAEIESSAQLCSQLINTIERQQVALEEELLERQEEAERRAKELLHQLEQEINELQMRSSELQHLELTQNSLHLLQSFPSLSQLPSNRDWSKVAIYSDYCMGAVRTALDKLVDEVRELANKVSATEADKVTRHAVDVTLDPKTASGWLILSPDGKKVSISSSSSRTTPLPSSPKRFDSCVCVLGKRSFTSGRHYWLVQVRDKSDWDLGVARDSISRKGAITVRPDCGFWAICRRKGACLSACTRPSTDLPLQKTPQKVGVYLDYEGGVVSFYDAETKTHIYTFSRCSFTEPLYPYFNPCVQSNGRNSAPLVICPVEELVKKV
ncbi:E3 ubiquitin-protein ligase TRIM39-like [Aulostomus maculatus]